MVYTSTLALFRQIRDEIKPIYKHEADMLAMFIVEDVSGFSSTDILTDHKFQTGPNFRATILKYILQLKRQEPIQYILGKAYFYDNVFEVNESTLIPRPETEELVQLVLNHMDGKTGLKVLDIGVGSGCIATSIALNNLACKVEGIDVSTTALAVAKRNVVKLGAEVDLLHADIFSFESEKEYQVIVSNPPYVRESEKEFMAENVLAHEPAKALFVPDDDALIYYNRIVKFANDHLEINGSLFFEVNESLATEVATIMRENGFDNIVVANDINGKDRFVYGSRTK